MSFCKDPALVDNEFTQRSYQIVSREYYVMFTYLRLKIGSDAQISFVTTCVSYVPRSSRNERRLSALCGHACA